MKKDMKFLKYFENIEAKKEVQILFTKIFKLIVINPLTILTRQSSEQSITTVFDPVFQNFQRERKKKL